MMIFRKIATLIATAGILLSTMTGCAGAFSTKTNAAEPPKAL